MGDSYRSSGLLALLAEDSPHTLECRFWETWVEHHLGRRSNVKLLEEAERQLLLRPESLQSHALAWSIALEGAMNSVRSSLWTSAARGPIELLSSQHERFPNQDPRELVGAA